MIQFLINFFLLMRQDTSVKCKERKTLLFMFLLQKSTITFLHSLLQKSKALPYLDKKCLRRKWC